MTRPATGLRRWTAAALLSTLALLVLGGLLRAMGPALGDPAQLEDLRRLAGMVLGLCTLGLVGTALWRHRERRGILVPALVALGCVGLQGFLGTRILDPADRPLMIAAHLAVTQVLVLVLLLARESARGEAPVPLPTDRRRVFGLAVLTALLVTVQILLGSQVRGQLDLLVLGEPDLPRGQWLAALGSLPQVHREVAGLVGMGVAATAMLATRCTPRDPALGRAAAVALVACVAQCVLGLTLTGRALPPDAQALHLPLSVVLFGLVVAVALRARRAPASSISASAANPVPAPDRPTPA